MSIANALYDRLFEEAELLFEQALVNAGLTHLLVIGGISVGVALTVLTVYVLKKRRRPHS